MILPAWFDYLEENVLPASENQSPPSLPRQPSANINETPVE